MPKAAPAVESKAYMELYTMLETSAQELESMDVPDVDRVMPLVTSAVAAYSQCKERIAAVRLEMAAVNA
jgi:exonuclease VII small subunit